jgi:hypothetical protein
MQLFCQFIVGTALNFTNILCAAFSYESYTYTGTGFFLLEIGLYYFLAQEDC